MPASPPKGDGRFPTTEWTLVARLKNVDARVSEKALDDLCRQYHYPLYCLIRSRGLSHHDAQDALQDFLAKLLRLGALEDLSVERGRLRTFLSKSLDRFLINLHRNKNRRLRPDPLIAEEERFTLDPSVSARYEREQIASAVDPNLIFDRQWGMQLLTRVLDSLRSQYEDKGKRDLFEALRPVLATGGSLRDHDTEAIAARLSMTPGALRAALLRLLRDYRELLVAEVRQTVDSKDAVEAEIAYLISVMAE